MKNVFETMKLKLRHGVGNSFTKSKALNIAEMKGKVNGEFSLRKVGLYWD